MPENVTPPGAPAAPPAPSSTPPGGTPPSAPAASWSAPANAPAWARGKSAEEILNIASAAMEALREPPKPAEPPPAPPPAAPAFADDEYITGAQVKQILQGLQRDTSAVDIAASNTLALAKQQYADDFRKYGGEIEGLLARVPRNALTLDNVAQVIRMVRSDHLDEIAHERAQRLVSEMPATLRSSGAAPANVPVDPQASLESEKIPAEWKQRALRNGITESTVREFCAAEGITVEAFYKQFDTPMNRIVEDISTKQKASA